MKVNERIDLALHSLTDSSDVFNLLKISIGRIGFKEFQKDKDYEKLDATLLNDHAVHIRDWLTVSLKNNEPWLQNVDDLGHPKKIMKCGSIERLLHEADKAMKISLQKNPVFVPSEEDEEPIMDLNNGYRIVRLLTPAALKHEGKLMQHCIGLGSYDNKVAKDEYCYLSLRDAFNKPHVTFEIHINEKTNSLHKSELMQFSGKQNAFPGDKYIKIILDFIKEYKIDMTKYLAYMDYKVFDEHGNLHPVFDLPDNFVSLTKIEINNGHYDKYFPGSKAIDRKRTFKIPKNMHIKGDFDIKGIDFNEDNSGLVVDGDIRFTSVDETIISETAVIKNNVSFRFCTSIKLPENFNVHGDLYIFHSHITELPEGLNVKGTLNLFQLDRLLSLPKDFQVHNLLLRYTKITEFTKNNMFNRLQLLSVPIKKFPKKISINESLIIERMKIDEFFEEVELTSPDAYVKIKKSKINTIPFTKNLMTDQTEISYLPEHYTTNGTLVLENSTVDRISESMTLENLTLNNTLCSDGKMTLPKKLNISGSFSVANDEYAALPEDTEYNLTSIEIAGKKFLKLPLSLPDELPVILNLENSCINTKTSAKLYRDKR